MRLTAFGLWADDHRVMRDNDEFRRVAEIERAANGKPSHLQMDEAFRARMHAAIAIGLESAPIGVVTTPGTQNPRYVSDVTARYHHPRDER
jgi:hypothetical protein